MVFYVFLHQVVDVKQSSVNMVPSKVEIVLRKDDRVSWGKLEDPKYKPEPEPEDPAEPAESYQPNWDIADDDISDSDDDWAYDTPEYRKRKQERDNRGKEEEVQNVQRKEVEEELKRAAEERKRAEEERKKLEEQRREEEAGEYEDMPELE